MTKRILTLLAVTCMLLTVFAACGKESATSDDPVSSSTPDISASVSDIPGADDTSTVPDVPQSDVTSDSSAVVSNTTTKNSGSKVTTTTTKKGSTSTGSKTDYTMPFAKPLTFSLFLMEHSSQPIKTESMKWSVITEMTNVTLDVDMASGTAAQTKLMAASASGKMYDITMLYHSQLASLKTSLFMDLTNVMKTETPHYYDLIKKDKAINLYRVGGKHLGFGQYMYHEIDEPYPTTAMCMAIRDDILAKNNLKLPTTWQEWFKVMKTLKAKYPNSTPYSGRTFAYILDYWTEALGGQKYKLHYNDVEGKYVCGALQDNFRSVLQFMNNCYNEGILDPKFDSVSDSTFLDGVTSNKVFFWIDNGVNKYTQNNALQEVDKNAKFVSMNLMKSHLNGNKKTGTAYTQAGNYSTLYCLSSKADHKDELLDFMDWCYTEEGMLVNCLGKEGVTYEMDKDGVPYLPKKVWSKYIDNAMPEYAYMSDLGLGQLCFAPRVLQPNSGAKWVGRKEKLEEDDASFDNSVFQQDIKDGCYVSLLNVTPDLDSDTLSRYEQINQYMRNQVVKFIKGTRALSEFSAFQNELKKLGIEDVLKACNS